jgi:hypothetical protein
MRRAWTCSICWLNSCCDSDSTHSRAKESRKAQPSRKQHLSATLYSESYSLGVHHITSGPELKGNDLIFVDYFGGTCCRCKQNQACIHGIHEAGCRSARIGRTVSNLRQGKSMRSRRKQASTLQASIALLFTFLLGATTLPRINGQGLVTFVSNLTTSDADDGSRIAKQFAEQVLLLQPLLANAENRYDLFMDVSPYFSFLQVLLSSCQAFRDISLKN